MNSNAPLPVCILNHREAWAAINAVCDWLRTETHGISGTNSNPLTEGLAVSMCEDLLHAVNADGMGGCPLCQG